MTDRPTTAPDPAALVEQRARNLFGDAMMYAAAMDAKGMEAAIVHGVQDIVEQATRAQAAEIAALQQFCKTWKSEEVDWCEERGKLQAEIARLKEANERLSSMMEYPDG
jgi:hypothetical protein